MDRSLAILVCLLSLQCSATTYYVRTDGNNANAGTATNTAWRNVWYAARTAQAGDVVQIGDGEFNEFVTNTVSGSAGSPITFAGTRSASGEWLTVIDPSTQFTNNWYPSDYGSNIYVHTNIGWLPCEMQIDHKRVAFVSDIGFMQNYITNVAYKPTLGLTNGIDFLKLAPDATVQLYYSTPSYATQSFWHQMNAIWAFDSNLNFSAYLKFKDGDDPNGKDIRIAPNGVEYDDFVSHPAIDLTSKSYLVYSNLLVRGAFCCVYMSGAGSHHNIIESNYLSGGFSRVALISGPHDNIIRGNYSTGAFYGTTNETGAWEGGTTSNYWAKLQVYSFAKHIMGHNTSFETGINLYLAGNSNVVAWNMCDGGLGVALGVSYCNSTLVYSNTIQRVPTAGVTLSADTDATRVFGNLFSDCNLGIRFHFMDLSANPRSGHIYRNRFYNPSSVGYCTAFHFTGDGHGDVPVYWFYHNSFSGGSSGFDLLSTVAIPNVHFINNIFSEDPFADFSSTFRDNGSYLGDFDYNLLISYSPDPAWFGAHNIEQSGTEWVNAEGMPFSPTNGSAAIDAALDTSSAFTLDGTSYPALPDSEGTKIGSGWDIGAIEYPGKPVVRGKHSLTGKFHLQ